MEKKHEDFLQRVKTIPKEKPYYVMHALQVFHNKWSAQIIFNLLKNDSMRFNELKRAIVPITNTMLASALKELEELGAVSRKQYNEIPPHTEYSLTEQGRELLPVFYELVQWGKNIKSCQNR